MNWIFWRIEQDRVHPGGIALPPWRGRAVHRGERNTVPVSDKFCEPRLNTTAPLGIRRIHPTETVPGLAQAIGL